MRLDEADRLLEPGYLAFESGYLRLADGSLHVASRTTMTGCKGRMIDFWFGFLRLFPDSVGAGLHRHCNEEMGYLAQLLPGLYEQEGPAGERRDG